METCLGGLNLHWCIIYLDDIVIFSKDMASHLERLEAALWKLEKAGLILKPSKCELLWQQIAYLGHMQSFLGFTGYYCKFIPKFVQVASPCMT